MGHLQENGYDVHVEHVASFDHLARIRADHGIPEEAAGCHTASIEGYTVEGHVPADVIDRLLQERPDIRGVTVPGMPAGSPGMESDHPVSYDVLAVDRAGGLSVLETRNP